jgi:hypothetical protein
MLFNQIKEYKQTQKLDNFKTYVQNLNSLDLQDKNYIITLHNKALKE